MTTEEEIVRKLRTLPVEKQQRVLAFVEHLHTEATPPPPRRTLKGIWSGFGVDVSEEDITAARRETWGGFPRREEGVAGISS